MTNTNTTLKDNPVNHPYHYTHGGGIECIDAIQSATCGITDGFAAMCTGVAIKYMWRWWWKGKPVEDLRKAKWYIERLITYMEKRYDKTESK